MSETGTDRLPPAAPLGSGRRLFAAVGGRVELEQLGAVQSPRSTHLRYRVVR